MESLYFYSVKFKLSFINMVEINFIIMQEQNFNWSFNYMEKINIS